MKRKLDQNDVPQPVDSPSTGDPDGAAGFESLGLDPRLLQGVAEAGYSKPTPIQSQAIPIALEGKDIVARAHTGSGKTAAYVLPVLQSILHHKQTKPDARAVLALILVPTKELARQVSDVVSQLGSRCAKQARVLNLSQRTGDAVVRAQLEERPEVVVATPARAMAHVQAGALSLADARHLVVDEADLILAYGHEEDLHNLAKLLPHAVQKTLMSATVATELNSLEKLFCHDAVTLEVEQSKEQAERMQQFVVKCGEQEKFLYLYAIFKLDLVKGKCLVFVHDIDRCYRLKLYLEQFGVRSCVLNSELPVNTRIHAVEQFNKNAYRIIIAADENEVLGSETTRGRKKAAAANDDDDADETGAAEEPAPGKSAKDKKKGAQSKTKRDREYGVSRGIDFKAVSLVLNFDLPGSASSYTHRIGRTGRAGQAGTAISFAVPAAEVGKHKAVGLPAAASDDAVLAAIEAAQAAQGSEVRRWAFSDEVRAFEYRCNDALRAVTRVAVRHARTAELRRELLNSDRLQRHFQENPDELRHLRHDTASHAARVQDHLRHVPEYLLPAQAAGAGPRDVGFVAVGRTAENGIRKRHRLNKAKRSGKVVRDRAGRKDPLRTFNARGRGKK